MSDEKPVGVMRNLLWVGLLATGVWLFFENLEARSERLESRRLVDQLNRRKTSVSKDIGRHAGEMELLRRDDPAAVKGALQRHGWIEKGRVAVDQAPASEKHR